MTNVAIEWKEALETSTNPLVLIQYVKEARKTLRVLGEEYDRSERVEKIISEADHEGNPVELLRQLIEGVEEIERLSFRG